MAAGLDVNLTLDYSKTFLIDVNSEINTYRNRFRRNTFFTSFQIFASAGSKKKKKTDTKTV